MSRKPAKKTPPNKTRDAGALKRQLATLALVAGGMTAVVSVRGQLSVDHKTVKAGRDVYTLPPAAQMKVLSLGYHAAVADMVWAHIMVSQGLHMMQRRRFNNLLRLYDIVTELSPTWRTPYRLADSLLTFQGMKPTYPEVLKARQVLETGVKNRPYDAELWLNLGQFVAFIAPDSYIEDDDPKEAQAWRVKGAEYLRQAAAVSGGDSRFAYGAVGALRYLKRDQNRDSVIRFLKRTYAVTEDKRLRRIIEKQLTRLGAESAFVEQKKLNAAFSDRWRNQMASASRTRFLVLGPEPRPYECAGDALHQDPDCATTWRTWTSRMRTHLSPMRNVTPDSAVP